jgi:hypothetical protein
VRRPGFVLWGLQLNGSLLLRNDPSYSSMSFLVVNSVLPRLETWSLNFAGVGAFAIATTTVCMARKNISAADRLRAA